MSESRNVFIFNGKGTGPNSTADLNELFITSNHIFPSHPTVVMNDFNFNMDGLSKPIFVVPGGNTLLIGSTLKPQIDNIKISFDDDFSYVGICAGAFLGVFNANLYGGVPIFNPNSMQYEGHFLDTTESLGISFNIIKDYTAFGVFLPDNSCVNYYPQDVLTPYCVNLTFNLGFNENKSYLSQLYVGGPAFIPHPLCDTHSVMESYPCPTSEVAAIYTNTNQYTFFGKEKYHNNTPLGAIVLTQPKKNESGKFLSATHIETCVENSKLLKFFETKSDKNAPLDPEGRRSLLAQRKEAKAQVESLLHETLRIVK